MTEDELVEADKSVDTSVENVPPAPEADAKNQGNEADSTPAAVDGEEKSNPFEKRIKELTGKVRSVKQASEAQLFEIRQENERLQKELSSRPEQIEAPKTLEDFEFDDGKYRTYLDTRTADIATSAAKNAVWQVETQFKASQREQEFTSREHKFESEVKDYSDVVYGSDGVMTWAASDAMADEIRLSDLGPDMAYHLAKNPDKALEISKLSERDAIKRMTMLEFELKTEKAKVSKSVSEAPPPPPKIPSGDQGLDKDPADMSDADFAKWRRKQIAKR